MRQLRTLDQLEAEYFQQHPEEVDEYLSILFEDYAQDGDTSALLASLRTIARAKGITATAETAGMSRKGLQKALSTQGSPKFASVNAILHALGYRLTPQKLSAQ
mgnify:CR=1 FL=1